MRKQRLRKSRIAKQAIRPTGTSDGRKKPEPRLDATEVRVTRRRKRERRVEAIATERIAEVAALDPNATVRTVRRGSKHYANMLTYRVDPSSL